jgi:hypothetical protein
LLRKYSTMIYSVQQIFQYIILKVTSKKEYNRFVTISLYIIYKYDKGNLNTEESWNSAEDLTTIVINMITKIIV